MFSQNYLDKKIALLFRVRLLNLLSLKFLKLDRYLSATSVALLVTLLFSQGALAESFGGYCIARKEEINLKQAARAMLEQNELTNNIKVSKKGHNYTISIDENEKQITLEKEGEQIPLDQMALNPEEGNIRNIILGKDNWLWIDRNSVDYVMKVNFTPKTAYFEAPLKLPELSAQPCSPIRNLFGKCNFGMYNYSPSLNRVFVSGYPKKSWGKQKYIHTEFISGEEKNVPELLAKAVFAADIPQWRGALFRGETGQALFYDGKQVIDLSQDFLKLNNSNNFRDWEVQKTAGGRSFIGKFLGRTSKDALFLMELKAKPGFKPIYLPEDFDDKWFKVFTLAEDPQSVLWIVSRKAIFAQIDRRIQTLVAFPTLSFITRYNSNHFDETELEDKNTIPFKVKHKDNKAIAEYYLTENSARSNCEVVLDLNQPILFQEIES